MDLPNEDALVAQSREGRTEAFVELARSLHGRIFRTIFSMTRNREDADDLTQETFMTAYRSVDGFKGRSSFSTWVHRIAINLTINFLKKKGREKNRVEFEENAASLEAADPAGRSPEGSVQRTELIDKIGEAVSELSPPLQAAFTLVVEQGMSHGQAAEILGCSENTVSWRIHKARKKLQARVGPFLAEVENGL